MADYNIEMQKRNPENTGWDKIYPITKGTNVIASNGKTFEEHVQDNQNPHDTNKSHVGLGSVLNYGISTQAAAESGTSNTNLLWVDTG